MGQSSTIPANGLSQAKWTVNEPFELKVFIENNEGQLDGKIPAEKGKILCTTRITGVDVYFTPKGVTYRYDKFPPPAGDEDERKDTDRNKPETHFFSVEWENANPNVELISEDPVKFYYCYPAGNNHTVFAHACKKILYKNIYNGIDIEYSFPANDKGLEYSVIIHPGANLSQVKLLYKDANNSIINSSGNIELQSSFGDFTDHKPTKVFYKESNENVSASFQKSGNEISFLCIYDKSKTLVIDPWTVNPLFTGYDAGYDINYDLHGNVYVYGSFNPYQEIKLDSTGNIQWIFNAIYPNTLAGFGSFAVDEVSGTSYLGCAGEPTILKLNSNGIQVNSYTIGHPMEELWKVAYSKCIGQLVIGGGGTADPNQICLLDTSFTSIQGFDILHSGETQHDVALLAIDNSNTAVYAAIMKTNSSLTDFDNVLVKCTLPYMTTNYIISDGFSFYEGLPDLSYIDGKQGYSSSPNGEVAGSKWIYLFDGQTLRRYYKSTGVNTFTKNIGASSLNWSGIDLDLCENIYVANNTKVEVLDTGLNITTVINATNQIYDLRVAINNKLIVCGNQFISSFNLPSIYSLTVNKNHTNYCDGAVVSATINGCLWDTNQYSYSWSNGATSRTVTGLIAGNYTVTVSHNCDFAVTDTFSVAQISPLVASISVINNIVCNRDSNADAFISTIGGLAPYTYLWSAGYGTNSYISGLSAGTYTVSIKDASGCNSTASVVITQAPVMNVYTASNNVQCYGGNDGSAYAIVSGGLAPYTYLWSNGNTTLSVNNLSRGVYSITIKDKNNCTLILTDTITQPQEIKIADSVHNLHCFGDKNGNISSTVTGGTGPYTYLWKPGGATGSVDSNLVANTYTLNITDNNGCAGFAAITITQPTKIKDSIPKTSVCIGDSVTLFDYSSGGFNPYTYLWSTGGTYNFISIAPVNTSKFILAVTDSTGCLTKDSSIIKVNPLPSLILILQSNDTICNGAGVITIFMNPKGGILSGDAVHGKYFYPDSAKTGAFNFIYYSYIDSNGCSASVTDSIYVESCTGIPLLAGVAGDWLIYPNPNNGNFNIKSGSINGTISLEIDNVLGQKIYDSHFFVSGNSFSKKIDLSTQPNGVYICQVMNGNGVLKSSRKFVIQK